MEITLEAWDHAMDSQAKAFLVGRAGGPSGSWARAAAIVRRHLRARAATGHLGNPGRDGLAKAALESLVRYFAVTLAPRGITVNSVSPGLTDDSILNGFPQPVVDTARACTRAAGRRWKEWNTSGHRNDRIAPVLAGRRIGSRARSSTPTAAHRW